MAVEDKAADEAWAHSASSRCVDLAWRTGVLLLAAGSSGASTERRDAVARGALAASDRERSP